MMLLMVRSGFAHGFVIAFFQRTENRAHKTHVFASVCSQVMKGWGGGIAEYN